MAAEIAASPAAHVGQTYWLTGPGLISNYDVAAVLSKLLGRTITYRELTVEENTEDDDPRQRRPSRSRR